MEENRQALHKMTDEVTSEGILEYLVAFISLFLEKFGGKTI